MKYPFGGFFKGKKILITGHTGFKGAWLSIWLKMLGADLAGYALKPSTEPSLFDILGLSKMMQSKTGDVRNRSSLNAFLREFRPEIIFHMAAQSLVRPSYLDPISTYETNVMGTVNLLDACRALPSIKAIVNVTSDKCYENHGGNAPYKEADPMGGHDPYSSSKGCAELVSNAYRRSYFNQDNYGKKHNIALASVRAGNVIGGGDWSEDRLIPDVIRAYQNKQLLALRYPDAVRPWQYVLEPLYGYLMLAKRLYEDGPDFSGAWNFGPGKKNEKPVRWIVENINKFLGGTLPWEADLTTQPHESEYLRLDSKKAGSLLGWHSRMDLTSALSETVEWYKVWREKQDMYKYSVNQINSYISRE